MTDDQCRTDSKGDGPGYQQALDVVLALVGIVAIAGNGETQLRSVINGILALSCVNSILAAHVIDGLAGRWTKQDSEKSSPS